MNEYNRMADALLSNRPIWIAPWIDERPWKVAYLSRAPRQDVLVLGSSRAMTISGAWFQPKETFNAAVRLGGIDDYIAIFQLCLEMGKLPDLIILELDPVLASKSSHVAQGRDWRVLAPYFNRALERYHRAEPFQQALSKLFSFPQLRQNMRALSFGMPWGMHTPINNLEVFPDGEVKYYAAQEQTTAELDAKVVQQLSDANPELLQARVRSRPEEFDLEILRGLLDDIQSRHIRLVVFLAPVHPITYSYYTKLGGLDEGWIRRELARRGVPVVGSYSPIITRARDADFFDDVHPRPELCRRLLAQANLINMRYGNDSPGSGPFLSGR